MTDQSLLPHFLIVGAPKCGTTALHHYLSQHPEVNTAPKEIHFFGEDLNYTATRPTLEEYQSYFKSKGINGDASVWYLYSDSIFDELKELGIQPKIIIMLRNPVEIAYALHSQNIADANEDVLSFEDALSLENDRKKGNQLPKNVDPPRTVFYRDTAITSHRILKFQEAVGRENVWIGLQEDLKKDAAKLIYEIEIFLSLPHFNKYNFEKINVNKTVKNPQLNRLIKKSGDTKKALFRVIVPVKSWRKKMIDKLYFGNLQEEKRVPMSENTNQSLQAEFKNEVSKLCEITGRDLKHWLL